MLRSDLCDYSDAYIALKGIITVTGASNRSRKNRPLALKNNAPFIGCMSKINNVLIDNAENVDIVMSMYNLTEYSKNYRKTTGSLWNYYRDELTDDTNDNNNTNKNVINSEPFKYKTSITGSTYNVNTKISNAEDNEINNPAYDANKSGTKEVVIVVPLKYLSNFWRSLKMPLINCEVSLILTWSEECVITSIEKKAITTTTRRDTSPTSATFKITDRKLYVPVDTLSTEGDNKLLAQLKTGFKRSIKWNKYRAEMTNQDNTNKSYYLIDWTFNKGNRLFVLSFKDGEDRTSFSKYYTPSVEIKDFNVLVDGKIFFDVPVKNKEETHKKSLKWVKNNNTTGNLLNDEYFSKHYKLIAIALSKQIELENPDLKQPW